MNDRAKILKVSAIIASSLTIMCLVFFITIIDTKGFTVYDYLILLIPFISCIRLWKMYVDASKM